MQGFHPPPSAAPASQPQQPTAIRPTVAPLQPSINNGSQTQPPTPPALTQAAMPQWHHLHQQQQLHHLQQQHQQQMMAAAGFAHLSHHHPHPHPHQQHQQQSQQLIQANYSNLQPARTLTAMPLTLASWPGNAAGLTSPFQQFQTAQPLMQMAHPFHTALQAHPTQFAAPAFHPQAATANPNAPFSVQSALQPQRHTAAQLQQPQSTITAPLSTVSSFSAASTPTPAPLRNALGLTSPISGGYPLQGSCHHCGHQLSYPLQVDSDRFPCPSCHAILTVRQVVRHAEESHYYDLLSQFTEHFLAPNSALVWLSGAKPTRTGKLAVPRAYRWPKASGGRSGYAEAFQSLGLVLRKNDTASGHWHCWYVDRTQVTFPALQASLKKRWKESPNYTPDALLDSQSASHTGATTASASSNEDDGDIKGGSAVGDKRRAAEEEFDEDGHNTSSGSGYIERDWSTSTVAEAREFDHELADLRQKQIAFRLQQPTPTKMARIDKNDGGNGGEAVVVKREAEAGSTDERQPKPNYSAQCAEFQPVSMAAEFDRPPLPKQESSSSTSTTSSVSSSSASCVTTPATENRSLPAPPAPSPASDSPASTASSDLSSLSSSPTPSPPTQSVT